jgi:hypothetical protein
MSVLPNQTNLTFLDQIPAPGIFASTITYTGINLSSSLITYSVPGLLSTSTVVPAYIHPGAGGAGQWIQSLIGGTDQFQIAFGNNTANGEQLNYIAKR